MIDGVIGDFRVNVNSQEIVLDRSANVSSNKLIVGDTSSTASVNAQAIHNISNIHVLNGTLDVDLLDAQALSDQGQDPSLIIGSPFDASSVSFDKSSTPLVGQISDQVVKGSLKVDETEGYAKALQLGGIWGYQGDFSDIDLYAQGIVTTTSDVDLTDGDTNDVL